MPRPLPIDISEYRCARAPEVDETTVTRTRNGVKADFHFSREFLEKTAETMNRRFEDTGDLYPLVIGHTIEGAPEHDQPQKVGIRHNFSVQDFEGRPAIFSDHYIKREQTVVLHGAPVKLSAEEIVEKFPRRSGEIWINRHEIDPHCLLGATAPERPLGVLRFSATGELDTVPYVSPGVIKMAKEEEKVTGENAQDLPGIKQIQDIANQLGPVLEKLSALVEKLSAGAPEPGKEGAEDHDAELEALIQSLTAQGGAEGDAPAPQSPPPQEGPTKLERENQELKVKLARAEVVEKLVKAKDAGRNVDPSDETLIGHLSILPASAQDYTLSLIPSRPGANPGKLDTALQLARDGELKPVATADDAKLIIAHADKNRIDHATAKQQLGYK